jgi:hypothetical protein
VLVARAAIALATCTLVMRRCIVSNKLLDHLDGLHKVYSDAIATILLRKQNALHTIEPAVDAKAK